jgi:hypothetical protein
MHKWGFIFCGLLLVGIIAIIFSGCNNKCAEDSYDKTHEQYKFGDRVVVVGGFFQGLHGKIIDMYFFDWWYWVRFDNGEIGEKIHVTDLRREN